MKIARTSATLSETSAGGVPLCRVEITADSGIAGSAVVADNPALLSDVSGLANELLGADARAVASHWQSLSVAVDASQGALAAAAAVIDCALWDLKANLARVPLWRALGALAPRVNVHARIARSFDAAATAVRCRELATAGVRGVVLESCLDPGVDSARLAAARDTLGISTVLMLDFDGQLHSGAAIAHVEALERGFDLTWIEAPAARTDVAGARMVSDSIRGAVCAGRHLNGPRDYLPWFHARAFDIVQIDTARVGISGALQIADTAFGLELPVALTASADHRHIMLAAALPYCASVEIDSLAAAGGARVERGWGVAA